MEAKKNWIMPKGNRVLVMQQKQTKRESRLVQEVSSEASREGYVLDVGPLVVGVQKGEYVVFAKFAGQVAPNAAVEADGIPILLAENEILASLDLTLLAEHDAERRLADAEVERQAQAGIDAERARLRAVTEASENGL